jgi:hypothetical protein
VRSRKGYGKVGKRKAAFQLFHSHDYYEIHSVMGYGFKGQVHIAEMFAAGNLNVPMFIHGTTPAGAPVMEKLHDQIHYKFQETEAGARVRISTEDKQAIKAVHEFLRFQIAEHQTGDRTDITGDNAGK